MQPARSCIYVPHCRGAQLLGWAAKSILPSMIHQIGVGICPERLDPAVVGVLTHERHSRVEALRLETCCSNHRHGSSPSPSPSMYRSPAGSTSPGQHYLEVLHVQTMCCYCGTSPPNCKICQRASAQLSVRQSHSGIAVPEVALASRSGSRRLRPTVSSCHLPPE